MNPTAECTLRGSFGHGDLKAISSCSAVPALVLSEAGSVPISAREEIEERYALSS
jgi:hypothetical protein